MDPEPAECAGCLRKIRSPAVWLCGDCVDAAVEAGFEATSFHHPGEECIKFLWEKAKERQRAEAARRSHG